MMTRETFAHLDDADIVRFIDAEGSGRERLRWRAHLSTCALCRGEVAALRTDSRVISQWLAAADLEGGGTGAERTRRGETAVPHSGPEKTNEALGLERVRSGRLTVSPWLKAAAITLLVAGPLVAVPGARGWVADRLGMGGEAAPPASMAPADGRAEAVVIRFRVEAGPFQVDVLGPQDQGTLTIRRVAGSDLAALELGAGRDQGEALVSPRVVRIENQATSNTSYDLALPDQVTAVSITVGGRSIELQAGQLDHPTIVPLQIAP